MPPRHAYWTIIVDDQPTSFRAHDLEELLPTFNRLREKHPNAQMKWFERGQLWESRDAAREQGFGQGERRWQGPRPSRDDEREEPKRDANWRPGGSHRDPRQKYKDAKKAKWDRYKRNIRARWEEKQQRPPRDSGEFTPPHGDPMRPKVAGRGPARPEWRHGDRHGASDNRTGGRPQREEWRREEWRSREPQPSREDSREGHRRDDRTGRGRPPWGGKPSGGAHPSWGAKPSGGARKTWGGKPSAGGRKTWGAKPSGGAGRKPWGNTPKSPGGFRKKPFGTAPPRGPRRPKKRREDEE